jgi:hypothetical protein
VPGLYGERVRRRLTGEMTIWLTTVGHDGTHPRFPTPGQALTPRKIICHRTAVFRVICQAEVLAAAGPDCPVAAGLAFLI